jgi:glutamate-1-semialdehyde 2,1-aminomutase
MHVCGFRLEKVRELTSRHGALLIFDEVISGFRVAPGGMTERTGIRPDLVVLGKILGGGLPVGAVLGPAGLMDRLAPQGPVYQAGTLSGNPLAMAAGIATLDELARPGTYERLEHLGARLADGWQRSLTSHAINGSIARMGSVLWLCLQDGLAPRALHAIAPDVAARYASLHRAALRAGLWLAPSAYEVAFVSMAHDEAVIDEAVSRFAETLAATNGAAATRSG